MAVTKVNAETTAKTHSLFQNDLYMQSVYPCISAADGIFGNGV